MAEITYRGIALANKLNPLFGTTPKIQETCSLIARNSRTYNRIQEYWASVEMSDQQVAYWEKREANLEKRITELVESLPETDEGSIKVAFSGDPRGHCVKLTLPGSYKRHADVWDQESIGADV